MKGSMLLLIELLRRILTFIALKNSTERLFDSPGIELSSLLSSRNHLFGVLFGFSFPGKDVGIFQWFSLRFYSFPFDNFHLNRNLIRNWWFSEITNEPNNLVDFSLDASKFSICSKSQNAYLIHNDLYGM